MLQNQPMDSLCNFVYCCHVFQWLTFVMVLYFHSTEAITSVLLYIYFLMSFFILFYFLHILFYVGVVHTCDAGVLKVIILLIVSNFLFLFFDIQ